MNTCGELGYSHGALQLGPQSDPCEDRGMFTVTLGKEARAEMGWDKRVEKQEGQEIKGPSRSEWLPIGGF